jgi:hypothetical protein
MDENKTVTVFFENKNLSALLKEVNRWLKGLTWIKIVQCESCYKHDMFLFRIDYQYK